MAVVAALVVQGLWYGPLFGRARLAEVGPGGLGLRAAPGAPWRSPPCCCWSRRR
ncbi:DUF1761 domain-containing protein [Novosphingobium rhizosphaerae]|uniref:DUF1761 domain-containing protein n=1 Tax=Novosphingobium rhizosphaerae TaxID=1551649 RepID=UPI003D8169D3